MCDDGTGGKAVGEMMDSYDDIEVETMDDEGAHEAIEAALRQAGCTWDDLQHQARTGRFSSETARRAWFVISSLVEPAA